LENIENVKGTHGDDIIDGNDNANRLEGLDGADMINGNDGDDTIIPNRPMPTADDTTDPVMDGSDVVDGGEHGDNGDTISYEGEEAARGVTIDLSTVVEAVEADPENNVVAAIAHVLVTVVDGANDMITVTGEGTEDDPHVSTIENIIGSPNDDTLAGDSRDNIIDGGPGGGTIDGGPGNDTLTGSGTINGGLGNDTLTGGPGGDNLNGGGGSDTIYAGVNSSGQSNDTIDAGDGTGIDDDPDTDADESAGETDIVSFAMVTEDTVEDVDADMATQGDQGVTVADTNDWGAEQVHGSPLADNITGSSGRDMIVGHDGDDTLDGNGGGTGTGDEFSKATADILVGAGGDDTLNGTDGSVEVFAVHVGTGGDDTITAFTLKEDHLHFVAEEVTHTCALAATVSTVFCTLSTDQTVTVTYTGTLTDPLDLDADLNIVNDPNAG
jgi:Ca2+-binding RTX toxin-like protein